MVRLQPLLTISGVGVLERFQSHYGAIATFGELILPEVRLKIFQSHYGAIATSAAMFMLNANAAFQSHYGAIATMHMWRLLRKYPVLSIPLWCDCNKDVV